VLWRDLQPAVLRYLRVAAPVAAQDLATDTWVSVIRGLARFTGDEPSFRPGRRSAGGAVDPGVAEVARITGSRPGAVRVLAHRGLRRLAERLEAAGLAKRGVTR
jgi:DNA-directed RNA polymerase specialized sigma24 family protein